MTPKSTTYPPRWAPTFVRWHRTEVSWWRSWKIALGSLRQVRDHTILDYAADLPGQDDVVVARLPFAKFVIVRSPELARHVLVANQDNYKKSPDYDMLAVAFGRGLVTDLDDRLWQRNRRLVQPIFAKRNFDRFAGAMVDAAMDAADRIRQLSAGGDPVDVSVEMNRLTLDVTSRTMFGSAVDGPMSEVVLSRLLNLFGVGFMTNLAHPLHAIGARLHRQDNSRLPVRVLRSIAWVIAPRAMRDLRYTERIVARMIADHRSGVTTGEDNLLALLMAARDPETGYRYDDREIHDELMTFMGAGMETTATALTWLWYLLAQHPDVRDRVRQEVDEVLGGRPATAEDVENLPWVRAVVAETMRLYPPVVALARTAKEDDMLGDFPVPAGTTIAVIVHGVHRNRRLWEKGGEFDPSRYLDANLRRDQKQATMPFGAGKRMCVASGFANLETTLVVATLVQRLDFDRVSAEPVVRQVSFTGGPAGPLLMRPRFHDRDTARRIDPA
nr:cytochrome P450 [Kibdelosporangium sp. MJ126-NF4]CTQ98404.1 cytochrome P450 [Kibdelosporangium sp. MJ126-NF4]